MLNKVMLIGRLGADPEVRYMPSGEASTTINLATNRRWKDRQTGEQKESTEWHRVVFFNIGNYKLAEIAGEYLKKGSLAYVEGRIQTRKWQDKNGQDRYSTEIIAEDMKILESKTGGTANFADNTPSGYAEVQAQPVYQQPAQQYNPVPPIPPAQQAYNPAPPVQPAPPAYAPVPPQQPFNPPPVQQPASQFSPPPAQQPFNPPPVQQPQFNQPPAQPQYAPAPPAQQFRQPPATPAAPRYDDFDDDVPF